MRISCLLSLVATLAIFGCSKKEEMAPPAPAPKSAGVSVDGAAPPPDAPPPPAPTQTDAADPGAEAPVKMGKLTPELVRLKQLCEKYFNDYGRFPNRWEDLINARYISKIPTEPDGKPMDYVRFTQITSNPE
jgi:hypothetical protein